MDEIYSRTVRLLLRVTPDVFAGNLFVMKGGTAINLFVRGMPRLSVDIDVAYADWQTPREAALRAISDEIGAIAERLRNAGMQTRVIPSKDFGDAKLVVESGGVQVKVEVNVVFRGTILPPKRLAIHPVTAHAFSVEMKAPILAKDELYGSKIVAALDRQLPRDLFDVWRLLEAEGLSAAMIECFVIYLAGHNRPTHEVLFSKDKDISRDFANNFVGMICETVTLDTLIETRIILRRETMRRLTSNHRNFLIGLTRANPDWQLLDCKHASELPALRWKLANLEIFRKRRPADFEKQAAMLENHFNDG